MLSYHPWSNHAKLAFIEDFLGGLVYLGPYGGVRATCGGGMGVYLMDKDTRQKKSHYKTYERIKYPSLLSY
jgi:hypothetical protein